MLCTIFLYLCLRANALGGYNGPYNASFGSRQDPGRHGPASIGQLQGAYTRDTLESNRSLRKGMLQFIYIPASNHACHSSPQQSSCFRCKWIRSHMGHPQLPRARLLCKRDHSLCTYRGTTEEVFCGLVMAIKSLNCSH